MESSLTIDDQLEERVNALANARQISPQAVMREAIRDYVDREDLKQVFLKEAETSWEMFQASEQHLTGDELFEWLDHWGGPNEDEAPVCHG